MKKCKRCQVEKSLDEFYKYSTGYYDNDCKPCNLIRKQVYAQKNPDLVRMQRRRAAVKYQYGVTLDEYEALMEDGCAVCGSKENLHLDHDHACCSGSKTCGKCIRGALCRTHNMALGMLNDSREELIGLLNYLDSSMK